MVEELQIADADKETKYKTLLPQIENLLDGEADLIANMANVTAALKSTFDYLWVGFYLMKEGELVLGPFQGPIACTRIQDGKGVCGAASSKKETVVVPNVDEFPGHIACSSLSKSEIVVPGVKDGQCLFVLDIDSAQLNEFDQIDQKYLEQIVELLI